MLICNTFDQEQFYWSLFALIMTPAPALAPPTSGSLKVEEELSEAWPSVSLVFLTTTRAALRRGRFCDCLWSSLSESLMNRIKYFYGSLSHWDNRILTWHYLQVLMRAWAPFCPRWRDAWLSWSCCSWSCWARGSCWSGSRPEASPCHPSSCYNILKSKKDAFWISIKKLIHLPNSPEKQAGTVQNRILNRAKNTPQPTRLGPMSLSSRVWNPLSPIPTKVMTRPMQTMPRPT